MKTISATVSVIMEMFSKSVSLWTARPKRSVGSLSSSSPIPTLLIRLPYKEKL